MADVEKSGKRYGLVCPKKKTLLAPIATNVFGNEEESSEEDGTDWVKKALKAEGEKNLGKKQTRLNIERALKQDPTICQYDEVFEDMKKLEEDKGKRKKKEIKKAKYIDNLLKTAERRKREQEHRIERMVQKEREAEGAMFADKESFVTSAYRAKLEEFNKMEMEEENMDRLESIGDVTKQPDMSGFYRHFYHRTMAGEKSPDVSVAASGSSDWSHERNGDPPQIQSVDDPTDSSSKSSPENNDKFKTKKCKLSSKSPTNKKQRTRQYRRRATESASESDSDMPDMPEPKVNEDAAVQTINTEIPIGKQISNDTKAERSKKKIKQSTTDTAASSNKENNSAVTEISIDEPRAAIIDNNDDNCIVNSEFNEKAEKSNRERLEANGAKIPKVSIWEKRTVGPVFVATLERYYARKAMRLGGS